MLIKKLLTLLCVSCILIKTKTFKEISVFYYIFRDYANEFRSSMVSIKDIAVACGVSIATVSKALNDHNDVSQNTKQVVREAAKRMGYLPNSQARALKTNKTYNLGVLLVDEAGRGLTHGYFAAVLDAFKVEAEQRGYDITFISKNVDSLKLSYYEHCKYRNVDGVIIACVNFNDPSVQELINSEIPVVTIDYVTNNKLSVISDNKHGMTELVDFIYYKGHRKIAYIYGEDSFVTSVRLKAYFDSLLEHGVDINNNYVVQAKYHDFEATEAITKQLLQLKDPPTCLILPDDYSAIGAINAIDAMKLEMPDDISIAGYDGVYFSRALRPRLTTLKQDTEKIGKAAAKQLISAIKKEIPVFGQPVVIKGSLWVGESVKTIKL